MSKINETLEEENFELQRLLCEIRAKNGLPQENGYNLIPAREIS